MFLEIKDINEEIKVVKYFDHYLDILLGKEESKELGEELDLLILNEIEEANKESRYIGTSPPYSFELTLTEDTLFKLDERRMSILGVITKTPFKEENVLCIKRLVSMLNKEITMSREMGPTFGTYTVDRLYRALSRCSSDYYPPERTLYRCYDEVAMLLSRHKECSQAIDYGEFLFGDNLKIKTVLELEEIEAVRDISNLLDSNFKEYWVINLKDKTVTTYTKEERYNNLHADIYDYGKRHGIMLKSREEEGVTLDLDVLLKIGQGRLPLDTYNKMIGHEKPINIYRR